MEVATVSEKCVFANAEDKTSSEVKCSANKSDIPKITNEYGPSEKIYLCDLTENYGPFWRFFRALMVWWRN